MKVTSCLSHLLLIAGFIMVGGCSRPAPLDRTVKSESAEQFESWRAEQDPDLSPDVRQDFSTAIQEIKLEAMDKDLGTMTTREESARASVNGKTVREVLVHGWTARRARLDRERQDLQKRFDHDSKLSARADQEERAQALATITRNEQSIIAKNTQLISEVDAKITAFAKTPQ